jgi:hypothetical protein
MRTFDHFPENATCPICGKSDDGKCTLIPIAGTQDGNNMQAAPVHVDCLLSDEWVYDRDQGFIYRRVTG